MGRRKHISTDAVLVETSRKELFFAVIDGGLGCPLYKTTSTVFIENPATDGAGTPNPNYIEIAFPNEAGDAPTTGNMGVLQPGEVRSYEYPRAQLILLYIKSHPNDQKVIVTQEGPEKV